MNLYYMNEDPYILSRIVDLHRYCIIALQYDDIIAATKYLFAAKTLHSYLTKRIIMQKEI